jgi:uncharacterized membrane protein
MKLQTVKEMGPVAGLCCRQSPLRGAIGGLIVCTFIIGAAFLCWHRGLPWYVWGG